MKGDKMKDIKKDIDTIYKIGWDFFSHYYKKYWSEGPSIATYEELLKKAREIARGCNDIYCSFRAKIIFAFVKELKEYYIDLKDYDRYLSNSYIPMGRREYIELSNNPSLKIDPPACYFEIFANVYNFNNKNFKIIYSSNDQDWQDLFDEAEKESNKKFYSSGKNKERELNKTLIIAVITLLGDIYNSKNNLLVS